MKKLFFSAFLILCALNVCFGAFAQVNSTALPTAQKNIYIAGNPDLYPLEFYNEKTKSYEGILPDIYNSISDQLGIDFTYVSADNESRQKQLGENFQVEIVSAFSKGSISVSEEIELFTYNKKDTVQTVCIGFTKIIDPDIAAAVKKAIQSADKSVWMSAAMRLQDRQKSSPALPFLIVTVCILSAALITLVICIIKRRRQHKAQSQTKMIDPLTGIGNLGYLEDCYNHHLSRTMRPLYYVAYIAIDIEKIETYFGLQESEELQRYAANTIVQSLNDNDFAARIENGVFAACFMCPDTELAKKNMTELVDNLNKYNQSYAIDNNVMFRCGLYTLDKQIITLETALFNARQGYLFAVNEKVDVCLCDKAILNRVTLKGRLQKKISKALENEEFHIYLQFIVDTKNNEFCSAEVLTRWHSPEEGVLSPANYIEDMKIAGMIDKLDLYVLEKTCALLSGWKNSNLGNIILSCNLTRTTLSNTKFSEMFEQIISKYDFDRSRLMIEITEDSLVNDSAVAYKNILSIKKHGCKIALDDFGSGYTSFRDLCDYPIDVIKIDRLIVLKAESTRGYAVLTSIIRMAHALGIDVLCEGIETQDDNKRAIDAQCDYIQGFLHSRVLPVENAIDFYENKK